MYQLILLIHVFAAVCVIALVLVQQGKGAGMGAAFGSGASSTVFGSRGSGSFLFRVTISFVAVFFITSITLNYLAMRAYKQDKVITLPAIPAPQLPISTPASAPASTSMPAQDSSVAKQPLTSGEIPARK
jgi:preprotein translocase subunit SecG